MGLLQRFESTAGPVVVGGHTIALVAKTRALAVGGPVLSFFHVHSRPSHVEVIDRDGERTVVVVHDLQRLLTRAIVATTALCLIGVQLRRGPE